MGVFNNYKVSTKRVTSNHAHPYIHVQRVQQHTIIIVYRIPIIGYIHSIKYYPTPFLWIVQHYTIIRYTKNEQYTNTYSA